MALSKIGPRFSKAIAYRESEVFIYTHIQVFCWWCSEVSLIIMSFKIQYFSQCLGLISFSQKYRRNISFKTYL